MAPESNKSLWEKIVEGLRQRPAYLLIFAISALFVLSGLGGLGVGLATKNNLALVLGFASFALALVGAVLVVREVERPTVETPMPSRTGFGSPGAIISDTVNALKSGELKEDLEATVKAIARAVDVGNQVLTGAILRHCKAWRDLGADWEHGQYVAINDYNLILATLYENAAHSVFSTSDATFTEIWRGKLGERLLEAHKKSKAQVTRVFVFNERKEVSAETIRIMEEHRKSGKIRVLAYFDSEDDGFRFSPDIARDFTIIDDGDAIGVTEGILAESAKAHWYFNDKNRAGKFRGYQASLEAGGTSLEDLLEWWKKNKETTPET